MPRLKRSAAEAQLDIAAIEDPVPSDPALVKKLRDLRNMWEFASMMQYIYIFGSVVKIDEDFDMEDFEQACLQTTPSEILAQIGLSLLKYVSSHRGLTLEIFAEYTRRQYLAKAPSRNPFGDDEDPTPFNELDVFTRVRILHQLSTWTFGNADRIRGLMPEDEDHLDWRIEPLGWDQEDRSYFVLDDNRLYRRTDAPVPPPSPKSKAKSKTPSKKSSTQRSTPSSSRAARAAKRRRIEDTPDAEEQESHAAEVPTQDEDTIMTNGDHSTPVDEDEPAYGFTSKTWECVAVTLSEYQDFLSQFQRTRDPNEKQLRQRIEQDVLPIIEKRAESIRQKQLKKLRELENMEKMATAKRSGRLADKADRSAKEREDRAAEEKKAAELRMAREEEEKQKKIEEGHESRRLTREQRLKEREVKRILHEEELARLEREASAAGAAEPQDASGAAAMSSEAADRKRLSSRNLQNQREAHQKELDRLAEAKQAEDDKWYFDCAVCGLHGENLDDGSHSVACERCNVWQHSSCHGFVPEQSERADFHFVCGSCQKKTQAQKEGKSGVVLKLKKRGASGNPTVEKKEVNGAGSAASPLKKGNPLPEYVQRQLDGIYIPTYVPTPPQTQQPARQHQADPQQQQSPRPLSAGHFYPPPAPHVRPPQLSQGSPPPFAAQTNQGHAGWSPQQPQREGSNGHSSPQQNHHNQHTWVHYNAIQTSGGHPTHTLAKQVQAQYPSPGQPQTQPDHGYGAVPNKHPMAQSQSRSQQAHPQQGPRQNSPPLQQRPPSQGSPVHSAAGVANGGNAALLKVNGTPGPARPAGYQFPSVLQQSTPQQQYIPAHGSALSSSPHTSFPPPSGAYQRQADISPMKSSPPRAPAPVVAPFGSVKETPTRPKTDVSGAMTNGHASPGAEAPATTAAHAPKLSSPTSSFESAPKLTNLSKAAEIPAPPSASANDVAADGMSGPWPVGALGVPQKNDSPSSPAAK